MVNYFRMNANLPMPTLYLGHGAPPLLEEPEWMAAFKAWAAELPRPKQILIVSAHWESAPVTVSATTPVPLVYDFYGFPEHYYRLRYDAPNAPELAQQVAAAGANCLRHAAAQVVNARGHGLQASAGSGHQPNITTAHAVGKA